MRREARPCHHGCTNALALALAFGVTVGAAFAAPHTPAQARTPAWLYDHAHFRELQALLQKWLAANARDADTLAWMARLQTRAGDYKGAVKSAERSIAIAPKNVLAHLALAESLGEEAKKANIFRQIPLARRVKRTLDAAVSLQPKNVDALGGLLQFYELAPGIVGGDSRKADQIAAQIVALDPVEGYLRTAWLRRSRRQLAGVEELYLQAAAADANHAGARVALARFYAGSPAKQRDAETHARAALAIDAALLEPYEVLAVVFARARRWNDLDAMLAQSDRHHPANLSAMYAAAAMLLSTGADNARAQRYLRRYLAQEPEIGAPSHADASELLRELR